MNDAVLVTVAGAADVSLPLLDGGVLTYNASIGKIASIVLAKPQANSAAAATTTTSNFNAGTATLAALNVSGGAIFNGNVRYSGNSVGGTNSGSGFVSALGYNSVGNKQLWLGDIDYLGSSAGTFVRFAVVNSGSTALLDAVAGDNSQARQLSICTSSTTNFGSISASGAATVLGNTNLSGNASIGGSLSATGTANLSGGVILSAATSTTTRSVGGPVASWPTSTDATRKGQIAWNVNDSAGTRTGWVVGTDGTQALHGFYGSTPVAKPVVTGSRGGNTALASLITGLAALNLVSDSTTA